MVVTCEPGLYFIPEPLNVTLSNPAKAGFLNMAEIQRYLDAGECRLPEGGETLWIPVPSDTRCLVSVCVWGGVWDGVGDRQALAGYGSRTWR
jgi:hypothetical protein